MTFSEFHTRFAQSHSALKAWHSKHEFHRILTYQSMMFPGLAGWMLVLPESFTGSEHPVASVVAYGEGLGYEEPVSKGKPVYLNSANTDGRVLVGVMTLQEFLRPEPRT